METVSTHLPSSGRKVHPVAAGFGLVALLTAVCLAAGCKKSQPAVVDAAPAVAETNSPPSGFPPVPPPAAAPVVIVPKPDGGADLKQLNHVYIGWVMQHRRRPQSFEEFVKLSGVQVPPPPAGKKYVIDGHGFINYANN